MIANVSRQLQKSRHAAAAVMTGGGVAAYAKHLDTAQGLNPTLNDVHHVAVETIAPPISHGVLPTGAVLSGWLPADISFATEGAASSCSAFATESEGNFHVASLPFAHSEVVLNPPGSPAAQPVCQLPIGIVCCPVLWPVWGLVPLDNRWNLSSGIYPNAFTNSAETTVPSVDIDSCRRTGTSRRQRHRQRERDGRVQIAAEEASVSTSLRRTIQIVARPRQLIGRRLLSLHHRSHRDPSIAKKKDVTQQLNRCRMHVPTPSWHSYQSLTPLSGVH
jgi:hypothetical protein